MKKLSVLFFFSFPLVLMSQVATVNNEYVYSPSTLIQSRWEKLTSNSDFKFYFRISSIGNYSFMDVKIVKTNFASFKIENGQELVFYFPNSDSLILYNATTTNSCIGCGAVSITGSQFSGIELSYVLDREEMEKLESSMPSQVFVNTSNETLAGSIFEDDYDKILKAIIITEK